MQRPTFWTYILTNLHKTVLYVGCTNNLAARLVEHWVRKEGSFTTRYNVHNLIWWQDTKYVLNAIALEKEIKDWTRAKKEALIAEMNPEWKFMNVELVGIWPPTEEQIEEVKARWKEEERTKNIQPISFLKQIV